MAEPPCPGHGLPCRRLITKKEGANKGRPFFVCAQTPQCQCFCWADAPLPAGGVGGKGGGKGVCGVGHGRGRGRGGRGGHNPDGSIVLNDVRLSLARDGDGDGLQLLVEFKYDASVIAALKEVPDARFAPEHGGWFAPLGAHGISVLAITTSTVYLLVLTSELARAKALLREHGFEVT